MTNHLATPSLMADALRAEILETTIGTPMMITPEAHQSLLSGGAMRAAAAPTNSERQRAGYALHPGGTAVVEITGPLLNRPTWVSAYFGIATYRDLLGRIEAARADVEVRRVVLDIDSHGGMVAGMFDFADALFAMRGVGPPIIAVVNETAASAAYLIAAAASEVVIPMTARLGSIGVVIAHLDVSKAMDAAGYAMTYVHAGAKKVDGHPYAALPQRVRDELQARVDDTYALFVDRVARYRGITTTAVRATQAGMFTGASAVAAGLANRVDSFQAVLDNKATTPLASRMNTPPQKAACMKTTASVVASSNPADQKLSAPAVWDQVYAVRAAQADSAPRLRREPAGDADAQPSGDGAAAGNGWDQVYADRAAQLGPAARLGSTREQASPRSGTDTKDAPDSDVWAAMWAPRRQ